MWNTESMEKFLKFSKEKGYWRNGKLRDKDFYFAIKEETEKNIILTSFFNENFYEKS